MNEQKLPMPFVAERMSLAAMLEGLAINLAKLHDERLAGLMPGTAKVERVRKIYPDRQIMFEARATASALRLSSPVPDFYDDLPAAFAGQISIPRGSDLELALDELVNELRCAVRLLNALLDSCQRAMLCDG